MGFGAAWRGVVLNPRKVASWTTHYASCTFSRAIRGLSSEPTALLLNLTQIYECVANLGQGRWTFDARLWVGSARTSGGSRFLFGCLGVKEFRTGDEKAAKTDGAVIHAFDGHLHFQFACEP